MLRKWLKPQTGIAKIPCTTSSIDLHIASLRAGKSANDSGGEHGRDEYSLEPGTRIVATLEEFRSIEHGWIRFLF